MSWHGHEDTWAEFRCPVTWCAAVKAETRVSVETLDDWANQAFLSHGHPNSVPTCAICWDIFRVIDIVTTNGMARVFPSK